eukprot:s4440_g3.t3
MPLHCSHGGQLCRAECHSRALEWMHQCVSGETRCRFSSPGGFGLLSLRTSLVQAFGVCRGLRYSEVRSSNDGRNLFVRGEYIRGLCQQFPVQLEQKLEQSVRSRRGYGSRTAVDQRAEPWSVSFVLVRKHHSRRCESLSDFNASAGMLTLRGPTKHETRRLRFLERSASGPLLRNACGRIKSVGRNGSEKMSMTSLALSVCRWHVSVLTTAALLLFSS